jgi:hypothetical protein
MNSAWSDITRLPLTHFLDLERSGTGPLCATEGDAVSDDPTTVLVERVTCEGCRDAINRRLASTGICADLQRNRGRQEDGRPEAMRFGS